MNCRHEPVSVHFPVLPFPMKRLPISFLLLSSLTLCAQDTDIKALLLDLSSPDFEMRQSARNELYAHALESADAVDPEALTQLEAALLDTLGSDSIELDGKLFVSRLLGMAATSGTAESLFSAARLPSQDPALRDHLIQALSSLPGPKVSQLILKGLAGASGDEATSWWQALARQASPEAAPEIISMIESGQAILTPRAIAAMGNLGGPVMAGFLYKQWDQTNGAARLDLELALLDSEACDIEQLQVLFKSSDNLTTQLAAFKQILEQSPAIAIGILAERLSNESSSEDSALLANALSSGNGEIWAFAVDNLDLLDEREQAVLIGAIGDGDKKDLEPVVLAIAGSGNPKIQAVALRALAGLASPASVPYLSDSLLSEDKQLQELAAHALSTVVDPGLDEKILQTVGDIQHPARTEYLELMAIRNNDGAVEMVNTLLSNEMNSAATGDILSAIEKIGDVESCRILIDGILGNSPDLPVRQFQRSLKRLTIRLGMDDHLWENLFLPAITHAPNDTSRARIVEILDCLSNSKQTMEYVTGLLDEEENPVLLKAASASSRRWTNLNIGTYWIDVARDQNASSQNIRTAKAALIRLITSDSIDAKVWIRADFAFDVLTSIRNREITQDILQAILQDEDIQSGLMHGFEHYRFIIEELDKAELQHQDR